MSKNKNDYKAGSVKHFGQTFGLSLTLLNGVGAVHEALWPSLEHVLKLAWEEDKQAAGELLNDMKPEIESFLRSQFVKSPDVELTAPVHWRCCDRVSASPQSS